MNRPSDAMCKAIEGMATNIFSHDQSHGDILYGGKHLKEVLSCIHMLCHEALQLLQKLLNTP